MNQPDLHTQAGRILALLDTKPDVEDWSVMEIAENLGLTTAKAGAACGILHTHGQIVRLSTGRYCATPHYRPLPPAGARPGLPLKPHLGFTLTAQEAPNVAH